MVYFQPRKSPKTPINFTSPIPMAPPLDRRTKRNKKPPPNKPPINASFQYMYSRTKLLMKNIISKNKLMELGII